jgi:hypothetical protein
MAFRIVCWMIVVVGMVLLSSFIATLIQLGWHHV